MKKKIKSQITQQELGIEASAPKTVTKGSKSSTFNGVIPSSNIISFQKEASKAMRSIRLQQNIDRLERIASYSDTDEDLKEM